MSQPQPIDPRLVGRRPARPKRRNWFGRIVGLVVLLFLLTLVCVPLYAWGRIDRIDAIPAGERPAEAPGTTYLMVGSDSREGLSAADKRKLGTGSAAGRRTDTIILLHVPESGPPVLISVPRDSWVPVPGYENSRKINSAYELGEGGPKLLVRTLESYTGLRIDHYVEIGFGGFASLVDSVGGVEVCPKKALKDAKAHINLPAGCQQVEGTDALGYVRSRYADAQGDLGRADRQREVIGKVAGQAVSLKTFVNPVRYYRIGTAGADALTMDEQMGPVDLGRFALAIRKTSSGEGRSLRMPIADPDARRSGQSVVLLDRTKVRALVATLKAGRTAELKSS